MEQINKVNYTGEGVEVCYTLTEKRLRGGD